MITAKAILYKSNERKDGTSPIVIRVIQARKSQYVSLGIFIKPDDWNKKEGRVKKSYPNAAHINSLILKKLNELDSALIQAEYQDKDITIAQAEKIVARKKQKVTFFDFAEEFIADKYTAGRINVANSLKANIGNIRKFQNDQDIYFTDITPALLEKLQIYLKATKGVSTRTIMNHLLIIRTLFNKAIRDGIVDAKYYPFGKGKAKIKLPESHKIGLEEEEIKRIISLDLSQTPGKFHARNAWLFSFYFAGMRISDVLKTKWSDIQEGRLHYRMGKNEKVLSIAVPQQITEILKHYESDKQKASDFVFPDLKGVDMNDHKALNTRISTACKRFNKHMKVVAKMAGIEKNISNHIARHSFGNIAGDQISPQMLQKLYRHSDIRTTMGYQANFINKNADDALEQVINF
jgi:integrase